MPRYKLHEIGGGVVRRRFSMGGRTVMPGEELTQAHIAGIRNRNVLIARRFIAHFPTLAVLA